ncbi:hypothetical protein FSP39_018584 [Pinctada imbricata]|uniref:UspA domain-containing protein n=1 Tax=Pinctada imbricata TaxID=66713 RepID=A0AA89CB67_PINIB|nr:hypothetical protein FSP39_018584 [Pinctada imbricata]
MATKERKVVIALDGSHHSEHAFEWYMSNFRQENDFVVIVHSFEAKSAAHVGVGADVKALSLMLEEEAKHCEALVKSFNKKLTENGLKGEVKNISGKPGEVVVCVAHDDQADVIICGSRGHGTLRRTFMGSVSDYIVHHSHVPVVVCRHKQHHHHGNAHRKIPKQRKEDKHTKSTAPNGQERSNIKDDMKTPHVSQRDQRTTGADLRRSSSTLVKEDPDESQ